MKTRLLAVPLLLVALAACGGHKRPPVVTGGPGAGTGSTSGRGGSTAGTRPSDTGPDVQPVDNDMARGEDFTVSDPETGEGGPLEDVHFDYDQFALTDAARTTLDHHAAWLKAHAAARVMVEGHCDERGTVEYNLALGDRRARAVHDYLVSLGVAAGQLQTTSYGKERPLDTGNNPEAWARNRRAHFTVSR